MFRPGMDPSLLSSLHRILTRPKLIDIDKAKSDRKKGFGAFDRFLSRQNPMHIKKIRAIGVILNQELVDDSCRGE